MVKKTFTRMLPGLEVERAGSLFLGRGRRMRGDLIEVYKITGGIDCTDSPAQRWGIREPEDINLKEKEKRKKNLVGLV